MDALDTAALCPAKLVGHHVRRRMPRTPSLGLPNLTYELLDENGRVAIPPMVLIMLLDHSQEVCLVCRNVLNVGTLDRFIPEETQVHCQ